MNRETGSHVDQRARQGFALGVAAYGLWGVLPVYFNALRSIDSADIVAHRILWSAPVLAALLPWTRTMEILFVVSILANIGMWIKRFVIVVPSLSVPLMPYSWGVYTPTWVELA